MIYENPNTGEMQASGMVGPFSVFIIRPCHPYEVRVTATIGDREVLRVEMLPDTTAEQVESFLYSWAKEKLEDWILEVEKHGTSRLE